MRPDPQLHQEAANFQRMEQRFKELLDALLDAIVVVDAEGRIVLVNARAEALFGYERQELLGQPVEILLPERFRDRHVMQRLSYAEHPRVRLMDSGLNLWGRHKDGREFPVAISLNPFELEGQPLILAAIRDVSERMQLQRELAESVRRLRALFDSTYQFIGLLTPDGTVIEANQAALDVAGLQRADVIGRPFWEIAAWWPTAEDKVQLRDAITRAATHGEFVRFESEHVRASGEIRVVDFSLKPVKDESGQVIMLIPEGRDITELRGMEAKLRESALRFRAIFNQTYQFIGLLKPDGTLLEANQSALEFVDARLEDVIGRPLWETPWWSPLPERSRERLRKAVARAASGKFVRYEVILMSAEGGRHVFDFSLKPVKDDSGRVVLLIPEGRDISERKQTEAALRRAQRQLKTINAELQQSLRRLEQDEAAGQRLQFQLLPEERMVFGQYEFTRQLLTSIFLSGDFVDYFAIDHDHIGFYMADVSGHGIPSALVTVLLKSFVARCLELHHQSGDPAILQPAVLLERLNRHLLDARLGKYLTMFYGVLDCRDNVLSYANGGQFPFPVVLDGNGPRYLECKSMPVGLFEFAHYRAQSLPLSADFAMVMVSDGILEVMPQTSLQDKESELLALVDADITVDTLIRRLGLEAEEQRPDDITLMVIRRLPAAARLAPQAADAGAETALLPQSSG
ncbi:MAG TPA: PAS domain S-box protein [Candidatus Competibacteraceae bacterium]|nr:PAS domain S-box protein [Candidatus Competibacteraceae bacterium]